MLAHRSLYVKSEKVEDHIANSLSRLISPQERAWAERINDLPDKLANHSENIYSDRGRNTD
jgi:hypothetical protein